MYWMWLSHEIHKDTETNITILGNTFRWDPLCLQYHSSRRILRVLHYEERGKVESDCPTYRTTTVETRRPGQETGAYRILNLAIQKLHFRIQSWKLHEHKTESHLLPKLFLELVIIAKPGAHCHSHIGWRIGFLAHGYRHRISPDSPAVVRIVEARLWYSLSGMTAAGEQRVGKIFR